MPLERSAQRVGMKCVLLIAALTSSLLGCGAYEHAAVLHRRGPQAVPQVRVGAAAPDPMALISEGVPAYSQGAAVSSVRNVNDGNYSSEYRCTAPCAADLDISRVPRSERQRVVFSWYNQENAFQDDAEGAIAYNEPAAFTIDVNAARGATGRPPTSGWTTLKSVTGNRYNSSQLALSLDGANWIRMRVTASNGSPGNTDASWQMDIASANQGTTDTWLFLGDSITNNSMSQREPGNFFETIHTSHPAYWPSQVNGGMSGWLTRTFLMTDPSSNHPYISDFLGAFPSAHFVTLNLGSNDIGQGVRAPRFLANLETLVGDVLKAGRLPIVPTIPWAPTTCSAALAHDSPTTPGTANYDIVHILYARYPRLIRGPDLWTYFNRNKNLISAIDRPPGCPHPTTPTGEDKYRNLWATTMLTTLYR